MAVLKTKIYLRNDTAINWKNADPVLGKGEVGIENDTDKMKLGDGVLAWSKLPYFKGDIDLTNLAAQNVYFDEDITLAGSYSSVGNVKLSQGTLSAKGKTVEELFTEIFTKELLPSKTEPSISDFKITSGTSFEAGTSVTPKWEASFEDGNYTYKSTVSKESIIPVSGTGVSVKTWDISKNGSVISHDANGTGTAFTLEDSNVVLSAKANYEAGNYALTNLNKLPATEVRIAAGSKERTATIYTYRKEFAGGVKTSSIDSTIIRGLSKNRAWSTNAFEFQAAVGDTKLIFAFPKNKSSKTPKFEYFTMSWEGFSGFVKSTDVEVADIRGGENGKITYTVYTYTPAVPFKAVTKFRVMM